jgi:hypothetical protein
VDVYVITTKLDHLLGGNGQVPIRRSIDLFVLEKLLKIDVSCLYLGDSMSTGMLYNLLAGVRVEHSAQHSLELLC